MEPEEKTLKNTHHGHAIKRIRHTLGVKQEALAANMGVSQALVSFYEQKKVIENDMLDNFAKALNIAPEFIKELEEDPVTFIIENNTFEAGNNIGYDNTVNINNPIKQILELNKEMQSLYERMLQLEKEKNTLLEKMLKDGK